IADLSRGTADLARQVAEFGRRLSAIEGKVVSANSAGADRMQGVIGEINELGALVKQLATTVESHDEMLAAIPPAPPTPPSRPDPEVPAAEEARPAAATEAEAPPPAPASTASAPAAPSRSQTQLIAAVKNAIEENRLDIYLQPMVTLPQRKV